MADEGIETVDLTETEKEDASTPEGEIVEEWTEEMRWKATAESLTALEARMERMEREKASQWQTWEERLEWMESRHRESEDDREKLRRELEELREAVEKVSKSPSSEATAEAEISKGETPKPEVTPEPSAGEKRGRKVIWA
jgi:septal ring factor EnvC (AmiA/AmiB activator)